MKNSPLSNHLPLAAAKLLQQAAQTPIPRPGSLVRQIAIEKAIERVRFEHPQFFKELQK